MSWPQATDYNAAVQNPQLCFDDPELRQGQAVGDLFGLPRPHAGNFADVYQVQCPDNQAWAVKCFTREVHGLCQRYQAVSDHLRRVQLPFTVDFHYLEQGIRIQGQWFPVLKMRWVEGLTLNEFVREQLDRPVLLEKLAAMWVRLAVEMREAGLGHGDLQHGNVLLVPGSKEGSLALRLIDYDGMCVPALADLPSGEVGHPCYQHPQRLREGGYSPEIDRFSHLVVYTALRCLALGERELWERHDSGENLLFREEDFRLPRASSLLHELWELKDPDVQALVGHLVLASQRSLDQVPLLTDLLAPGGLHSLSADEEKQVKALLAPRGAPARRPRPPAEVAVPALVPLPAPFNHAAPAAVALVDQAPAAIPPAPPPLPATFPEAIAATPPPLPPPSPRWALAVRETVARLAGRLPRKLVERGPVQAAAAAGAAGLALVLLVAWWLGSAQTAGGPAGVPPRLLGLPPVLMTGGDDQVVEVTVDRNECSEPLTLRAEGLPEQVKCAPAVLEPGGTGGVLWLRAADEAEVADRPFVVSLWVGDRRVDRQPATLTVRKLLLPSLPVPDGITLRPGEQRTLQVPVQRRGCTGPLTLKLEGLPDGLEQGPSRPVVEGELVPLEVKALATARAETHALTLSLWAGGRRAHHQLIKVQVEPPTREPGKLPRLEADDALTIRPGGTRTLRVLVDRQGYAGEVEVKIDPVPPGLQVAPATVPAGETVCVLQLRAEDGADERKGVVKLVALVDGRKTSEQDLTVTVQKPAPATIVVGRPGPLEPRRRVEFVTTDQVTLRGTFYPGPAGTRPSCVLLLHDLGGDHDQTDWKALADALQRQGYTVFTFDFRGHGDSRKVDPTSFWAHRHNQVLPQYAKVKRGLPVPADAIGQSDFIPAYYPVLLNDVNTARSYLHYRNDAIDNIQVSSSNLIVIGAGEGATLGALWLASECQRHAALPIRGVAGPPRLDPSPESQSIAAVVWLSLQPSVGRRPVAARDWLPQAARDGVDVALVHGQQDVKGAAWAQAVAAEGQKLKGITLKAIPGTNLSGERLLDQEGTVEWVTSHLRDVMAARGALPWALRNEQLKSYWWAFPGGRVEAKGVGERALRPIPLDRLGGH